MTLECHWALQDEEVVASGEEWGMFRKQSIEEGVQKGDE